MGIELILYPLLFGGIGAIVYQSIAIVKGE